MRYTGYQYFQDVDKMDQTISGNAKPSNPKPNAAFVANQLIVRAAAKFDAEDESGDRLGALADVNQADQLQPNDLPTLQLRAMVRLKLEDKRGFLDDLNGRANTLHLLMTRGGVCLGFLEYEQAVEDLVAADQMSPGAADTVCNQFEDMLTANGGPQSLIAKLTAVRHSIHTRIQVSLWPSLNTSRSLSLVFALCCYIICKSGSRT